MLINFGKFSKRELEKLRSMVLLYNAKLEHQRGNCENNKCETCLYTNLCWFLLDLQEEVEKRL